MYQGNQGEIDLGSSWCVVQVSEGSIYWESTVFLLITKPPSLHPYSWCVVQVSEGSIYWESTVFLLITKPPSLHPIHSLSQFC